MNCFPNSAQEEEMMTNVFLYGCSGTGKTILGAEIVKIKLSQMNSEGRPVRAIVSQYNSDESVLLLENFRDKYFKNI